MTCPGCAVELPREPELFGQLYTCTCGTRMRIPWPVPPSSPSAAVPAPEQLERKARRDTFASMAMAAMLSDSQYNETASNCASAAVRIADALIAELDKPKP